MAVSNNQQPEPKHRSHLTFPFFPAHTLPGDTLTKEKTKETVSPTMETVEVRTLTNKALEFHLDCSSATVSQLKCLVQDREGIPPDHQRIVFAGRQLSQDNATLAQYGLTNGSRAYLVLRLRDQTAIFVDPPLSIPPVGLVCSPPPPNNPNSNCSSTVNCGWPCAGRTGCIHGRGVAAAAWFGTCARHSYVACAIGPQPVLVGDHRRSTRQLVRRQATL